MNDTLQRFDRELEAKWHKQQTLAQLAEIGITFPDKGHEAFERDYRWRFTPVEPVKHSAGGLLVAGCFAGLVLIGFICFMNWAIPLVKR